MAFSRAPMLDYLGELVGVKRLPAQAAQTTLQFSVAKAQKRNVLIPEGTRASASNSVMFATDDDVLLPAGSLSVDVTATCTTAGEPGNDWQPAQISALVDSVAGVDLQVTNITASGGGCADEGDDALRERIRLAPGVLQQRGQLWRVPLSCVVGQSGDYRRGHPRPG